MDGLFRQIRHFVQHPPFAPGGHAGQNILPNLNNHASDGIDASNGEVEGTLGGDGGSYGERGGNTQDGILVKYLPLLLLMTIFWPVLVTLFAVSLSASSWLVWLCVSMVFGLLQLVFVLYNFVMIVWDLTVLTVLKTFAMLRTMLLYYTYKAAAGVRRRRGDSISYGNKKRRRKEWREFLDKAKDYEEYCRIDVYEPASSSSSATNNNGRNRTSAGPVRRSTSGTGGDTAINPPVSNFRRRTNAATKGGAQRQGKPPRPPPLSNPSSRTASPSSASPIRKAMSCLNLQRKGARRESISSNGEDDGEDSSAGFTQSKRNYSTNALRDSFDEEENEVNDCPMWKQIVQEDLGITGMMLLTTMSRLREARLQASSSSESSSSGAPLSSISHFSQHLRALNKPNDVGPERKDDDTDSNGGIKVDSSSSSSKPTEKDNFHNGDKAGDASSSLKFLLSGIVKRNHLSVDDVLIDDARSVAERGQHAIRAESRDAIQSYSEELERCVDWVASGPILTEPSQQRQSQHGSLEGLSRGEEVYQQQREELSKRHKLVKRMKQNMGRTALMLSGGGAQAMYHLGTIKALVESGLYENIHVISGTSGGSITAAMCAIKSPKELLRDICIKTVSTDFGFTGRMKRENIRWFPELHKMGAYWLKHKLLVDSADFKRCCEFYYSDITFEEAFEMTGKHVCITVSASRSSSGAQRLLLNNISTPDVTLASAVAASCALPGVMAPAKLMIKDSRGKQHHFEVDGVEWIDGSVQADLPFKRISTLFNVSNYVVAQTNFHVVPFLNKAHHPNMKTLYWKLFQMCEWDIRSRALNLSRLGLFPRLFGHDMSKVFKQKYHGNLTLVPRFTTLQTFGLKALVNPTVEDMEIYLQNGQTAAWPFIGVIKEMVRMERAIDACLTKLEQRIRSVASDLEIQPSNDELESLSSNLDTAYRARLPGLGREAELLKEKVFNLENENMKLKKHVTQLQEILGIKHSDERTIEGRCVSITRVEEEHEDPTTQEEKKVV